MSQVLILQDCREDRMKMAKHFGKLKTVMQMRCMIILLPQDVATWMLGGPELPETDLSFISLAPFGPGRKCRSDF